MSPTPTRVRYSIVAIAVLVNFVSYTDRACISVVGPQLRAAFGLTPTELGAVFGSFSLSYALLQAPWGAVADRRPAGVGRLRMAGAGRRARARVGLLVGGRAEARRSCAPS